MSIQSVLTFFFQANIYIFVCELSNFIKNKKLHFRSNEKCACWPNISWLVSIQCAFTRWNRHEQTNACWAHRFRLSSRIDWFMIFSIYEIIKMGVLAI